MRLMQVMAGGAAGGAEAFFVRLTCALAAAGVAEMAVIRRHPGRAAELRAAGVETLELPFGGLFDLTTGSRLKRAIAAWRPQVVLAWMNRAARFTPKGPYVLVGNLCGYYSLKYYRRCDHLIGPTPDVVAHMRRGGWPEARTHTVPNFAVPPRPDAEPVPRASLATPEGAPLLLAIGRLHRVKGLDLLLAALARLPRAYLWIAGEGPERVALERQAAALGVGERVRFLGWRADVAELLLACDAFVLPSRHESFGIVVLEAWAAGKPVIAAAAPGPAFLIEPGRTGLLTPVEDPRALASAIAGLLADPERARALGAAGRAAYLQGFTEAAVTARYLALLERLAETHLPGAVRR